MTFRPTVQLASLPDRENLVAEIFIRNDQLAEISQDGEETLVEIYSNPQGGPRTLSLSAFLSAIEEAKQRLLSTSTER